MDVVERNIWKFLRKSDEETLRKVKARCEEYLNEDQDSLNKKAVMRAAAKKKGGSFKPLKMNSNNKVTIPKKSNLNLKGKNFKKLDLKSVTSNEGGNDVYHTTISLSYKDDWGSSLVYVNDVNIVDALKKRATECKKKNQYFPYGFGNKKDQLKVKKLDLNEKGVPTRVKLTLKFWNMENRSGYSCYAQIEK